MPVKESDLVSLGAFFAEGDLAWKPVTVSKKTGKALVAPYVTNRAVQQRLDEVCGPANWCNQYKEGPASGVICGISVLVEFELAGGTAPQWVTKWDGAENTDIEPVKGGLSDSMRRAAVHWGIGRYLYNAPKQWVPADQRGQPVRRPRMPADMVNDSSESHKYRLSEKMHHLLIDTAVQYGIDHQDVVLVANRVFGVHDLEDLTEEQAQALVGRMTDKAEEVPA